MQCRGRRANGEVFQADVWFSTYLTSAGPRLAAMVLDTSEDLRIREEANLHQLLAGSRILVAAVSHEVRNVCGAIAFVHESLTRGGMLKGNKDFEALGTLVLSLERIAAMDLRQAASEAASTDIRGLLDELRIVIESALLDSGVTTAVADRRRCALGLGRPAEPDAGVFEPDQEQRARHAREQPQAIGGVRIARRIACSDSFYRYGMRGRASRAALSAISSGGPVDRIGTLSFPSFHAQLSRRPAIRGGERRLYLRRRVVTDAPGGRGWK